MYSIHERLFAIVVAGALLPVIAVAQQGTVEERRTTVNEQPSTDPVTGETQGGRTVITEEKTQTAPTPAPQPERNKEKWNEDGITLGPRVSWFTPKDGDADTFVGVQGRTWGGSWGLEGSIDYREDSGVKVWPVQASILGRLNKTGPLRAFFLAGAGAYYTTVDTATGGIDTETRLGYHGGGGLEWFIQRDWSLDATYRHLWIDKFNKGGTKFDDSGNQVTVGLNFHFF